jgi:hypothetical protein
MALGLVALLAATWADWCGSAGLGLERPVAVGLTDLHDCEIWHLTEAIRKLKPNVQSFSCAEFDIP